MAWEATMAMLQTTVSVRHKWKKSSHSTLVSRKLAKNPDLQDLAVAESIEVSDLAFHQDVAMVTLASQTRLDLAVTLDMVPIPPTALDLAHPPQLPSLSNARMFPFTSEDALMHPRRAGRILILQALALSEDTASVQSTLRLLLLVIPAAGAQPEAQFWYHNPHNMSQLTPYPNSQLPRRLFSLLRPPRSSLLQAVNVL